MKEKQATFPSLFTSGIRTQSDLLDTIASGAGVSANIPFFKDITDQSDEVQVENTGPTTDNGQPSGKMVAPILNRVTKNSATALASAVSGADPLGSIINQLLARRGKQRNTTLVSILRGLFGTGGAAGPNSALKNNLYTSGGSEIFIETTAGLSSSNLVSPSVFIYAKALMGELADDLASGVFFCHPNVKAALEALDSLNFKTGKPSDLPYDITTYRGVPIITSSLLVRAGTTSGFVYDSYLIGAGVVGYGEKSQAGDVVDVASLQYWRDPDKNNELIYDRTRFMMHIEGTKWIGAPAGQSASNSELATIANWNLAWQTSNRIPAVAFRTNG